MKPQEKRKKQRKKGKLVGTGDDDLAGFARRWG